MLEKKSMSRMSFMNTIFGALLLAAYISGITSTVCGLVEHATWLFDAEWRKFELTIRTETPEWYRKGIQFLAFTRNGARFEKRYLSWGIERDSENVPRQTVINAARLACDKWSAAGGIRFSRGPVQQPDIRIRFERFNPNVNQNGDTRLTKVDFLGPGQIMDRFGTRIVINDNINWTNPAMIDWHNIEYVLLRGFGHSLGLGFSDSLGAMMYPSNALARDESQPLDQDDIDGIQDIYGPPGWTTEVQSSSTSRSSQSNRNRDRI